MDIEFSYIIYSINFTAKIAITTEISVEYKTELYSRLSLPTAPKAKTELEPVKMWQSPCASVAVKPSLHMVPHRPAKNIFTRPAVRYMDVFSLFETNKTPEVTILNGNYYYSKILN